MANIHPSSSIDEQVQLADDVHVGPYCVITGDVRIGAGTRLIGNIYLNGPLSIGQNNILYPFTAIGFGPQNRGTKLNDLTAGIQIGDDNIFREGVTIHCSLDAQKSTVVGNENYLMTNSHLGHDVQLGNTCTLASGALMGGHVTIEDNVTIGGNAAVHQFCRIGRLSILSGVCGITMDLPPFCSCFNNTRSVGCLNLVGLRRAGYRDEINTLRKAFSILYRQGHTNANAIAMIEKTLGDQPLCLELATFVKNTERGILPYKSSKELKEELRKE